MPSVEEIVGGSHQEDVTNGWPMSWSWGRSEIPHPLPVLGICVLLAIPAPWSCPKNMTLRQWCDVESIWTVYVTKPATETFIRFWKAGGTICLSVDTQDKPQRYIPLLINPATHQSGMVCLFLFFLLLVFFPLHYFFCFFKKNFFYLSLPLFFCLSLLSTSKGGLQITPKRLPEGLQTNRDQRTETPWIS